MESVKLGLIGLGTVGTGVVKVLQQNADVIKQRLGLPLTIKQIAVRHLEKDREVKVDRHLLTRDPYDLINDPDIDILIELIGGYEPARTLILSAIEQGKHIVTANKALLARYGHEIFSAASAKGVDLGFEASVGGGVPIIRALREGFAANHIQSIYGIVNGTANYILSKMTDEGRDFHEVLKEAQEKGYAEPDPTFDIEGIDSAHKIAILCALAFGAHLDLDRVYAEGITHITPLDIAYAREFGFRIKLLAIGKRLDDAIEIRVHPTMIPETNLISTVDGVLNAFYVVGDAVDKNIFIGRGAGAFPTASAVIGDLVEISRNIISNHCGGRVPPQSFLMGSIREVAIKDISDIVTSYYLRFSVVDKPGVLSKISGVLGKNNISISSVIQKGRHTQAAVPVVIMTHEARERDIRLALEEIDQLDVVLEKTVLLRVEEGE